MTQLPNGQLDIVVRASDGKDKIYRTLEVLSDFAAESILGRATRVYKAQELKNGVPYGDVVVLKDQWIDSDRIKEGDIYKQIRNTNHSRQFRDKFALSFLTVLYHGIVFVEDDNEKLVPDDTRKVHLRGEDISANSPRFQMMHTGIRTGGSRKSCPVATGYPFPPRVELNLDSPEVVYDSKVHYRIVFKEVCRPLYELTDLREISAVIFETCSSEFLLLSHVYPAQRKATISTHVPAWGRLDSSGCKHLEYPYRCRWQRATG